MSDETSILLWNCVKDKIQYMGIRYKTVEINTPFNIWITPENSLVNSKVLPCFKYKRQSPNEVETFKRSPSYYMFNNCIQYP